MENYDDAMSKMALALTSCQVAKNYMVEDFGIGEELPFTFMLWANDRLAHAVQIRREFMLQPVEQRLQQCTEMCNELCSAQIGMTGISFIAEGFETLDKSKLNGRQLRQAFIDGEESVTECITVTHCEKAKMIKQMSITLLSLPYEYGIGRTVKWGKPMGFVGGTDKILKTSSVSRMLIGALANSGSEYQSDDDMDMLLNRISSSGFNIESF